MNITSAKIVVWKSRTIGLMIVIISILICCNGARENKITSKSEGLFQTVNHAERFKIDKQNGFTQISVINPWQGAKEIKQVYTLVKRGDPLPAGFDSASVIFTPVKKIICMSTTHVGMILALREEETISGVSGAGFLFSDVLVRNAEEGRIKDVGYEINLNKELILKISPDLIMMYGIGSESAGYVGKIKELGIHVFFNADYLETDPLAKAEWIKLFGALYCKEHLADSIYSSAVQSYNGIKDYISKNISYKPKVLLGLPYKDTWYISPGNSFVCKLISDAGGSYLWKDTESSVSMPYAIESVYLAALSADYWLNIGDINSKDEIIMMDQRLGDLPCVKMNNLFNNNKRVTKTGGNDYWESGTLSPNVMLKDIATILHPELFKSEELYYYRKIN
jgi:iron complex transport system substrate-binding protein